MSAPTNFGDNSILRQADLIRERLGSALKIVDEIAGTQPSAPVPQSQPITEKSVRALLKLRRNRGRFFEEELFADPAWDMLLELYAAELGQQRISVSSLCLGAAVPMTTALRWIAILEKKRLIDRHRDPIDGRRIFISLSVEGVHGIESYFRTVPNGTPLI